MHESACLLFLDLKAGQRIIKEALTFLMLKGEVSPTVLTDVDEVVLELKKLVAEEMQLIPYIL